MIVNAVPATMLSCPVLFAFRPSFGYHFAVPKSNKTTQPFERHNDTTMRSE